MIPAPWKSSTIDHAPASRAIRQISFASTSELVRYSTRFTITRAVSSSMASA